MRPSLARDKASALESPAKKAKYTPWAFIAIIAIVASVIYFLRASPKQAASKPTVAAIASPQALLIERKELLEFDPENNAPSNSVSPQERKLGESVMNALQIAGDGKDKTKVQAAIGAIAGIIHTYPDYSDAYVARATYSLIAGDTDYQQIRSDLDNAIKYHSSGKYHSVYSSTAPIYSLLAKAAMLVKDYQGALTDLPKEQRMLTSLLSSWSSLSARHCSETGHPFDFQDRRASRAPAQPPGAVWAGGGVDNFSLTV